MSLTIMSGVEDGTQLAYDAARGDGLEIDEKWSLTIGRKEENDIVLRNDSYVSRQHAKLHFKRDQWWLEDCESTNGTFLENPLDFFNDEPVKGVVQIEAGQIFRVGRTWMRIEMTTR